MMSKHIKLFITSLLVTLFSMLPKNSLAYNSDVPGLLTGMINQITSIHSLMESGPTALPVNACTATGQDTLNSTLNSILGNLPAQMNSAPSSDTGQSAIPVRIISQLGAGVGGGGGGSLTNTELRASAVPVSGTFWQTTQPISGSVSVSNFPSSQAVTGSFYQATQPISGTVTATGPVTDTQLRASPVPVSGTFYQATQPVSLASAPTTPVTGTFWQATQPISASAMPLPTGASTSALQTTGNSSLSSIDSKTPALGQALAASSTPVVLTASQLSTLTPLSSVSVSNFPATQPVSGTVSVGTVPVTGTFFQSTQPVSIAASVAVTGPATDTQLRATPLPVSGTVTANAGTNLNTSALALDATLTGGTQKAILRTAAKGTTIAGDTTSTPVDANTQALDVSVKNFPASQAVTGTFFQATQPVSLATAPTTPVTGTFFQATQPVSIASMPSTPVTGTFFQATQPISGTVTANAGTGTQAVSIATAPVLVAGSAIIGKVGIDQTTPGTTNNVAVTPPTLTKGTQGSTGFSTQDLKDSGRTNIQFYAVATAAGTTGTETIFTLTKAPGTGATSTGTSFVITSGKRFRITSMSIATRGNVTATIQSTTFNLRVNTAGACIVSSTPIILSARSATPATASAWDRYPIEIPDGMELLGDGTATFCLTAASTYVTNGPTWDVLITGFEY